MPASSIDVVADQLDTTRLDGLFRIGVDEVSYRKGHRYLTVVADHDRDGAVVWAAEGKSAATLEAFYDQLGSERCAQLEAVSLDMGGAYKKATDARAGQARQCVDPFHLVEAGQRSRRQDSPLVLERAPRLRHRLVAMGQTDPLGAAQRSRPSCTASQLDVLHELRRNRSVLYRCWQLKEGVRDLYRLARPADAAEHLDWWLAWACRSRIPAFVTLSKTVRANRDRILAAVELGLSNSKLEGLNSKIRLINHRGYGHHSAAAIIAMIYLCCGGITVELPFK